MALLEVHSSWRSSRSGCQIACNSFHCIHRSADKQMGRKMDKFPLEPLTLYERNWLEVLVERCICSTYRERLELFPPAWFTCNDRLNYSSSATEYSYGRGKSDNIFETEAYMTWENSRSLRSFCSQNFPVNHFMFVLLRLPVFSCFIESLNCLTLTRNQ